jgi:beta-galactosidase
LKVENEYGFCGSDRTYLRHLVATARQHLGDEVILYTTDPPPNVARGSLPGDEVYTCVAVPLHKGVLSWK